MKPFIPVLVGLVLAGCGERHEAAESKHETEPGEHGHRSGEEGGDSTRLRIDHEMLRDLRITTTKTESRTAGERVTVLGELGLNQNAYAEVAAPVAARVVKVLVDAGQAVKTDQPLVELYSPELGTARATHAAAKVRADLAATALARKRDLAADKLITAREVQEAEAAAATADADARVAWATLQAFGIGAASTQPARLTLRAPVSGTVIERAVVMGQLADPARTLFRIGDLSHLWLTAHVFERDAVRVPVGGTASVTFAALPGRKFEAKIAIVGREVESTSRTIPVRLDVANPDGALRPGMSATLALPLGDDTASVVTVPLTSVQRVSNRWVVFVPQPGEGVFEIRPIGRGRDLGGEVEVVSGLRANEDVVVDGAFLLKAEADKARGEGGAHDH
jgi:membrane fusion protein, heavy metal efflux system